MKLQSLTIMRQPTYAEDAPGGLIGTVSMKSLQGEITVRLTAHTMINILENLFEQVPAQAAGNAEKVSMAVNAATEELLQMAGKAAQELAK